jgi:putative heme-binding domain-containing protein
MQPQLRERRGVRTIGLAVLLVGLVVEAHGAEGLTDQLRQEPGERLLADARAEGDAVGGAVLFANRTLACAACHHEAAGGRIGPDLRQMPETTTDQHLLESLLYPSREIAKGYELTVIQTVDGRVVAMRVVEEADGYVIGRDTKPPYGRVQVAVAEIAERAVSSVSAMPDGLPDQMQSRQQFLDILRYLMDLRDRAGRQPAERALATGGELPESVRGAVLFDQHNCRACHDDGRWQQLTAGSVSADRAPRLENVRAWRRPQALVRYLADPHTAKPGTRMPDLLAGEPAERREQIATELVHYLISRGDHAFVQSDFDNERADRGNELFHSVGCVACHSPRDTEGRDTEGNEKLPAGDVPLGDLASRASLPALVAFLEDPLAVRPAGRMPSMQLAHEEAEDLAHYLLQSAEDRRPEAAAFAVEASLADAGREHYQRLQCAACHEREATSPAGEIPLEQPHRGCLSGGRGDWPLFDLSDEQRRLLMAFCDQQNPVEPQPVVSAMATLNCYACHQRDGIGGIDPERDPFFQTADFNLGPQGRMPPSLTGVGNKLQPQWLRQVLVSGRSVRPYMKTRMPRFGVGQVEPLVELLPAMDDKPDRAHPTVADPKEFREAGHTLAGNQGLNCIACHTFQRMPAATMSALDLTEMTERLQRDWFVDYLLSPQTLSPGTVMPSFWPGGKTTRPQILDGDTQRQLDALWIYLEQGRQARPPRGLVQEPLTLLASEEAVMLRRSWPGVGKRGIGVGYPEQVNLVFDAEQMRLAMLWKGRFADPGGVWRSQGHGTVRPLDGPVLTLGDGPDLTNPAVPWEPSESQRRPPGFRFAGYELDDRRRPRLRYVAAGVTVEEFFVPGADQSLRRTVVLGRDMLDGARQFRLLAGKTVEPQENRSFVADTGLRLNVRSVDGLPLEVVETAAGQELRVTLPGGTFGKTLEVEYAW